MEFLENALVTPAEQIAMIGLWCDAASAAE